MHWPKLQEGIIAFDLHSYPVELMLLPPLYQGGSRVGVTCFMYSKSAPDPDLGDLTPELVH